MNRFSKDIFDPRYARCARRSYFDDVKCSDVGWQWFAALEETSSHDWWKHMKNLMGASSSNTNEMQGLANKCTGGDMTQLVNSMNDLFVSVSADLPRLDPTHRVFDIEEPPVV